MTDSKRFSRIGGPDLSSVRGFKQPVIMSRNESSSASGERSSSGASTAASSSTSAYDQNFEQILSDNNICMDRRPLSPSKFTDNKFEAFVDATVDATSQAKVMSTVLPKILGESSIYSGENLLFSNLRPLIDGVTAGKPDLYDGIRSDSLDPQIRKELSAFVVPSTQPRAPVLPTFFVEAKGPDGSVTVAQRQACYDGALGARGFQKLELYEQSQQQQQPPESSATVYTIVSTYQDGFLRLYTVHITPDDKYKMTLLRAYAMTNSRESFAHGASAIRNVRDWAGEQRSIAVTNANQRLQTIMHQDNDTTAVGGNYTSSTVSVESTTSNYLGQAAQRPSTRAQKARSSTRRQTLRSKSPIANPRQRRQGRATAKSKLSQSA
ncbi:MAG: hypothetical protein M1814_000843 [Vezdaea aestivalis]|nr:MAG: hypothetical protein M1814_000843 [Vezdaea aestivalis]